MKKNYLPLAIVRMFKEINLFSKESCLHFSFLSGHGGQSAITDGTQPAMLVLSGGEGYIDFRVGK